MSDQSKPDFLEALAQEKARHLELAAAADRKMAAYMRLKEEAAALNLALVPATITAPAYVLETLGDLFEVYKTVPSSPYKKLSHASRKHYDAVLGLIRAERGTEVLKQLTIESFKSWYASWSDGGKKAMAFAKIKMVRLVVGFGTEVLHNPECERLFGILSKLRFEKPPARSGHLTSDQAILIRHMAHDMKRPSIALAQAFQWDIGLLQKDTVGEWIPLEGDGVSDITDGAMKWVRGLRWNEIDQNMILRHPSEGWQSLIEFDLHKAPMVLEELRRQFNFVVDWTSRATVLPAAGPVVVNEYNNLPWTAPEFRRWWRQVADECEIPKNARNSDSRPRSSLSLQEDADETGARLA